MSADRSPEDLSERELLVEMNRQLAHIRMLLGGAVEDDRPDQYRCHTCGAVVDADERRRHLSEHNAPPDVPVEHEFDALSG